MQTQQVDIFETEWVELTQGSNILLVSGGVDGLFLVHFTNTAATPVLNAPAHRIHTYQQPFDFAQFSFISGQRVWVRSTRGNAFLYVTRAVTVFTGFVPLGSDRLITSDANIFLVQEV